ncbi:Major Facilitator Superfamily protein [Devosia lucknowensis]|uniref:Major Facilitator Superfamily protein n=1 Tax=Devosia lucknowensis TaxID=1096929 RepID=A0A1Y6ENZ2_9HYPH|nr:MFS transporter [Devosia lucknowensis]SMQ62941.1 Major Facilitator Superfamily protein [Devosia lucknowensis]
MSDTVEGRWAEIFGPRYLPVTTILALGVTLFAFNAFLSAAALPSAVHELGGVEVISWATTLYLVFAIVGGAAAALLKRRLGSRGSLIGLAAVFLVGTLVAAIAGDMTQVLVGRAVQGFGEGVVAALCFALIPELFPSRLVPKVFGMQAVVWAVAAFGGPAGAGALTELISWRAAFLINVPFVLIFITMVLLVVPRGEKSVEAHGFPGVRLLTIGAGTMLVALAAVVEPAQAALLLVGAAALLGLAAWLDRRATQRLMPPDAFSLNTAVGSGLWVFLLMPVAGAATAVYLIMLLQQLWDYGPTQAAVTGAVMAVAWSLSSVTVANVRQRATRRILIRTGPLLLCLGLVLVLMGLEWTQLPVLLVGQALIGMGFGISNGYIMLTIMEASTDAERDRTSALLPTTQSAGNALGAALAGVAANAAGYPLAVEKSDVLGSIIPLFVMAAAFAILAFLAALRMVQLAKTTPLATFAEE